MESQTDHHKTFRQISRWPTKWLLTALETASEPGSPVLLGRFGLADEIRIDDFTEDVRRELEKRKISIGSSVEMR
jgi:hypothetical protein